MSVYHIDSFETYPDASALSRRYTTPDGGIAASAGRRSSQAWHATEFDHTINYPVPSGHTVVGVWWYPDGGFALFRDTREFIHLHSVSIEFAEADGELHLDINGTEDFTGRYFAQGNWYFIEMAVDPSTNQVRLWLDGEKLIDRSDIAVSSESSMWLQGANVADNGNAYFDNLYIVDASDGTGQTDALGPVRMGVQKPNADTADADFTPQGGGANHDEVDEAPDDADSTYVESGTVGDRDRYELESLGFQADSIIAAQVVPVAKDPAGGGGSIKSIIEQNGSEATGSSVTLGDSYGDDARTIHENNPATGSPWTQSELEDATAGQEVT